jgi:surfeit locus 1 family protein
MRREQLPQLQAIVGTVEVLGEVYVPLGEVFALGSTALPRGWPKRMQTLDHGALAGALGVELYPYVVRLKPGTATAFESHWQDVNIAPEKHIAYAVQWFSMAIALLLLYLAAAFGFINSKQRMRR